MNLRCLPTGHAVKSDHTLARASQPARLSGLPVSLSNAFQPAKWIDVGWGGGWGAACNCHACPGVKIIKIDKM